MTIGIIRNPKISSPYGCAVKIETYKVTGCKKSINTPSISCHCRRCVSCIISNLRWLLRRAGDMFYPFSKEHCASFRIIAIHLPHLFISTGKKNPSLPHHGRAISWQRDCTFPKKIPLKPEPISKKQLTCSKKLKKLKIQSLNDVQNF